MAQDDNMRTPTVRTTSITIYRYIYTYAMLYHVVYSNITTNTIGFRAGIWYVPQIIRFNCDYVLRVPLATINRIIHSFKEPQMSGWELKLASYRMNQIYHHHSRWSCDMSGGHDLAVIKWSSFVKETDHKRVTQTTTQVVIDRFEVQ